MSKIIYLNTEYVAPWIVFFSLLKCLVFLKFDDFHDGKFFNKLGSKI